MIRVLFFARLADLAKVREAEFDCLDDSIRLDELLRQVVDRFPALKASLAQPKLMFLAINQAQALIRNDQVSGNDIGMNQAWLLGGGNSRIGHDAWNIGANTIAPGKNCPRLPDQSRRAGWNFAQTGNKAHSMKARQQ